jgi:hypothetical protein
MKVFKRTKLARNIWNPTKNHCISISADGLNATNNDSYANLNGWQSVYAKKGFIISADFSEPSLYYFEITMVSAHR